MPFNPHGNTKLREANTDLPQTTTSVAQDKLFETDSFTHFVLMKEV